MAKKTDEEKLKELEEKIEQARAKKQQIEKRVKEKDRRERTRRLIQLGAIFEKGFDIKNGEKEAQQIVLAFGNNVKKTKNEVAKIDVEKSTQDNIIFETKNSEGAE